MIDMMSRGAILAAALLVLSAPIYAETALPVTETGHGYTCNYTAGDTPIAAETVTGEVRAKRDPGFTFAVTNSRVPAQIGTGFGIAYSQTDATADMPDLMLEVTHPPMGTDGTTRQSWTAAHGDGPDYAEMYLFEAEYELLPGMWTMRLMQGDHALVTRSFEVYMPDASETPDCGPDDAD